MSPSPLRLAILTSSLPPNTIGGAEIQAHATAIRLAARGHRVTVFARAVPGDTPGRATADGVRWVRTGGPAARLGFPGHVGGFLAAWRRADPVDAVLAYQTVIPGVLGSLVRSSDRPLTTWIRSQSEFRFSIPKYRMFTPWVLGRSRHILVQSAGLAGELEAALARSTGARAAAAATSRVQVLGNAVEVAPLDGPVPPRPGFVFVGRLVPAKGLEVLLSALRDMEAPPPVTVYGDGPLRGDWEALARGLPVTFAGAVAPDRVRTAVAGARALVVPSHTEGFPNAILEAMERGVPPVASAVGGIPEVVTDGVSGRLVPPGDPASLAAALREMVADDALRDRLARGARAEAETRGWDGHLDRLESVLRS